MRLLRLVAASAAALIVTASWAATATAAEPEIETVVADAESPTNLAFGPNGSLYYTEKDTGRVREVSEKGVLQPEPVVTLAVTGGAETGLLGIAPYENWLYLYFSDPDTGTNRIVRIDPSHPETSPEPIIDLLPTSTGYHNGGDVAFGPDGMLYATVGEMHEDQRAQDPEDLGGKIIRLTPDGDVPADNPFGPANPAWSMGHRNSFGICFDPETGQLWETENGPDSHDEVNLIQAGGNYGWPDVMGPGGAPDFIDPVVDFPDVVVPTGCTVWGHALWFGDYSAGQLYRLPLTARAPAEPEVVADLSEGITDVARGTGDALYIATQKGIYKLAVAPPAGQDARSAPPVATPEATGKRSLYAPAVIAAVLALIVVLAGGWWFARIRRREQAGGDAEGTADATSEDASPPDA